MEHNKVLGKGRLDNYLSWMGLGIVTAGLAVTIVQFYCTITSYYGTRRAARGVLMSWRVFSQVIDNQRLYASGGYIPDRAEAEKRVAKLNAEEGV
jgi:hypothetical protein